MKKLYAFAAVACMAMTAFAQDGAPLYITGDGEFETGVTWAPENASELVFANGAYTLEVKNLSSFKLSTVKGTWDEFNTAALTCDYGDVPGEVKDLVAGSNNISCPWKGDYTITVSGDLKTIKLETETPGEVLPPVVYVRGDMNGWGADEAWAMTSVVDNKLYKFVFADGQEIALGEAFKLADADWNKINMGAEEEGSSMLETDIAVFTNGKNMTFEEVVNGVIWLILDLDGANYVWASNDKEAAPEWADLSGVKNVEVAEGAVRYFNLQGVETVNPANGLYIVVRGNKATKEVVR